MQVGGGGFAFWREVMDKMTAFLEIPATVRHRWVVQQVGNFL